MQEQLHAQLDEGERLSEVSERLDLAEEKFRHVLKASRELIPEVEIRALNNLVTLYAREERSFECIVLGRVLVERSTVAGDTAHVCKGLISIAGALQEFNDWERMEPVLAELDAHVSTMTLGEERGSKQIPLLGLRVARASALGYADEARALVGVIDGVCAEYDFPATYERYRFQLHIDIARRAEDWVGLRELLDQLAAVDAPLAFGGLDVDDHRCQLALESGDHAEALVHANRLFELLTSQPQETLGLAQTYRWSSSLARSYNRMGRDELSNRAYEIASTAVARRILEIGSSLETLPELREMDADDRAALARYRLNFGEQQEDLLEAVGSLFRRNTELAREVLERHRNESGLLPVCAWCRAVRVRSGAWTPIGHLVPTEQWLAITHTICEDCESE